MNAKVDNNKTLEFSPIIINIISKTLRFDPTDKKSLMQKSTYFII